MSGSAARSWAAMTAAASLSRRVLNAIDSSPRQDSKKYLRISAARVVAFGHLEMHQRSSVNVLLAQAGQRGDQLPMELVVQPGVQDIGEVFGQQGRCVVIPVIKLRRSECRNRVQHNQPTRRCRCASPTAWACAAVWAAWPTPGPSVPPGVARATFNAWFKKWRERYSSQLAIPGIRARHVGVGHG